MTGFIVSPEAEADLEEIWRYTSEHWDIDRADRYIDDLFDGMELVSKNPGLGRGCDEVRPGYLKFAVASHMLFYRLKTTKIEIVRVLHQRMDSRRHL